MDDEQQIPEKKLDITKVKNFFTNNKIFNKTTLVIVLVLACMFLSLYYRGFTATLPVTDSWAQSSVKNQISNSILAQINQQFPNLPESNKQAEVDKQLASLYNNATLKAQITSQEKQLSDLFKSKMQDSTGQTYLLEIDPYMWLRRAEHIAKDGSPGVIVNGKLMDPQQFAPIGKPIAKELHPYLIYYAHQLVKIFNPKARMFDTDFWIPAILSMLAVIPAFFIVKKRAGIFGGLIAGIIVAIQPTFIARTMAGFSDTDAYAVVFPLFITWVFIEALDSEKIINKGILAAVAGVLVGLFSFAWGAGWWYIFDLLIGLTVIYLAYQAIKHLVNKQSVFSKEMLGLIVILAVFVIVSAITLPVLSGDTINSAALGPIMRTKTQNAALTDYWPNIQTTVAELGPIDIPGAIGQLGNRLFFFIAIFGLVLTLTNTVWKKKDYYILAGSVIYFALFLTDKALQMSPVTYLVLLGMPIMAGLLLLIKEDRNIKHTILLTLWLLGSLFAATHGTRFLLVMVPGFALAAGLCLGLVHKKVTEISSKSFKMNKAIMGVGVAAVMLLLLVSQFSEAKKTATMETPLIDDAWWDSLVKIKDNSQPNAIINSWWDFGHWFAYVADRDVTVDGAGQEPHLAHWMGTVLITDDEDKAVSTLRMLDCGSNEAYNTILGSTKDVMKSVKLIQTIILQDQAGAKETLYAAGMTPEEVQKTLAYTFCEPPENFLITSEDMVGKTPVWAHFGAWDFDKSYAYINSNSASLTDDLQKLGLTKEIADNYANEAVAFGNQRDANTWISPWPQYLTGTWIPCEEDNGTMTCTVNRVIASNSQNQQIAIEQVIIPSNLSNSTTNGGIYSSAGQKLGAGPMIPHAYVFYGNNTSAIQKLVESEPSFQLDIVVDLVNKRILVTDPLLSESLFTKLFYLEGRYTNHFEKFSDAVAVNGQRIIVWKVNWEGKK